MGDTDWFWSSSVQSDNSDYAWSVNFGSGYVSYDGNKNDYCYVRCVRSDPGPAQTLCEGTGGTWEVSTCNCGGEKVFDPTEGCKLSN